MTGTLRDAILLFIFWHSYIYLYRFLSAQVLVSDIHILKVNNAFLRRKQSLRGARRDFLR